MAYWEQIGGDVNADRFGAVLAKYWPPEHDWIDVVEIRPLEDSLNDDELLEFGAGWLVGISSFDAEDLDGQFQESLDGLSPEDKQRVRSLGKKDRRLFTARFLASEGLEDTEPVDGTFGDAVGRFADDPQLVRWWSRSNNLNYDPLAKLREQPEPEPEYTKLKSSSALAGVHVRPHYRRL